MWSWIAIGSLTALCASLIYVLYRAGGQCIGLEERLGEALDKLWLQDVEIERLLFRHCRTLFFGRGLGMSLEAHEDEDHPGRWSARATCAPIGAQGLAFEFGAAFGEDGRRLTIWVSADIDGMPLNWTKDIDRLYGDPNQVQSAETLLARAREADFRNVLDAQRAAPLIKGFFGENAAPCWTTCFDPKHVTGSETA